MFNSSYSLFNVSTIGINSSAGPKIKLAALLILEDAKANTPEPVFLIIFPTKDVFEFVVRSLALEKFSISDDCILNCFASGAYRPVANVLVEILLPPSLTITLLIDKDSVISAKIPLCTLFLIVVSLIKTLLALSAVTKLLPFPVVLFFSVIFDSIEPSIVMLES